jgi:hypothetical protein
MLTGVTALDHKRPLLGVAEDALAPMWKWRRAPVVAVAALGTSAFSNTTTPGGPVRHIAAYVAAPTPVATSMQAVEPRRHAVLAEDALTILQPRGATRTPKAVERWRSAAWTASS